MQSASAARSLPQFIFNEAYNFLSRAHQGFGEFQYRGQRRLLVAEFQNADIGPPQIGLEAEFLLRQAGLDS